MTLDKSTPAANDWTADEVNGQRNYWKYRQLPDGSYYYVTNFNVGSSAPLIHAAGYVQRPLANKGEYVSRLVEVTATNPPSPFMAAIAANGAVVLNGSAIVDGYDSSKGPYDPATNRTANGQIATNSKEAGAVNIGSGRVSGEVLTGPGAGPPQYSDGAIGDVDWTSSLSNRGIEANGGPWFDDTMNVQFQPNSPPTGPTLPLTSTHVGSSNVTYLTADSSSYIYTADNFISKGSTGPIIVTGNCTLYVSGNFIINGNWYVYIQPNASLNLYVGGKTSIAGGGIVNGSGLPSNFSYYGLTSNTSMSYSGTADWVGTINAPQADFKINGSASLFGAIICNSFASTGSTSVHYDQQLRGGGRFVVTSWREL
jgi:hypothetical protein